jgi:hypothetical protein
MDGEFFGRGTTNVDFTAPLCAALAQVRDSDQVGISVGVDRFELSRERQSVVERKVSLPIRWLKGFVEAQAYQARMDRGLEVSGVEARRFLRSLPRASISSTCWIVPTGRALRLSQHHTGGAIGVGGIERLRVLEDLSGHAKTLRIYFDQETQASAWELVLEGARFHLVLSPEVSRGFSGEGQALDDLAGESWRQILPRVHASLRWESSINMQSLARTLGTSEESIKAALSVLGARGLVGLDLAEKSYFHRELPFDLSRVDVLQPRLKEARTLVAEGKVQFSRREGDHVEAFVEGTGVEHRVTGSGEEWKCTCPWYAKHRGNRGPCKHVLAVQIAMKTTE